MNSNAPARMTAALEMARDRLQLDTLETRNSDRLDFHAIDVASVRDCVQMAFDAGYAAGVESRQPASAAITLSESQRHVIEQALEARRVALLQLRDTYVLTQDQFIPLSRATNDALEAVAAK